MSKKKTKQKTKWWFKKRSLHAGLDRTSNVGIGLILDTVRVEYLRELFEATPSHLAHHELSVYYVRQFVLIGHIAHVRLMMMMSTTANHMWYHWRLWHRHFLFFFFSLFSLSKQLFYRKSERLLSSHTLSLFLASRSLFSSHFKFKIESFSSKSIYIYKLLKKSSRFVNYTFIVIRDDDGFVRLVALQQPLLPILLLLMSV